MVGMEWDTDIDMVAILEAPDVDHLSAAVVRMNRNTGLNLGFLFRILNKTQCIFLSHRLTTIWALVSF